MKEQSEAKKQEHPYNLQKSVEKFEQGHIRNILQLSNGNKALASEMLGIEIHILEQKIQQYEIVI